jgi:hypothetical protein
MSNRRQESAEVKAKQLPSMEDDRASYARGKNIEDQIGRQFRDLYQDVLNQPIPDRFIEILKSLDGRHTLATTQNRAEINDEDL